MEFRIEKRTLALMSALVLWAPAIRAQTEFRYEVWHGHSRPPHIKKAGNMGALFITSSGMLFEEQYAEGKRPKHLHRWFWDYRDIRQLKMGPRSLTVLTYQDDKWKLGADRQYQFDLVPCPPDLELYKNAETAEKRGVLTSSLGRCQTGTGLVSEKTFLEAYPFLKQRLDQRFVAGIAERPADILWEIPVKHLLRFGGDEGVLRLGTDTLVYSSDKTVESRTWRYEDIENISSSGPFQLTVTTFERAATHYGDLKGFNFALKERLEETRYNDLWLRLNQAKGLKILDSYREAGEGQ
jgi:hypothetical protein